jgi:hypothetical protein
MEEMPFENTNILEKNSLFPCGVPWKETKTTLKCFFLLEKPVKYR